MTDEKILMKKLDEMVLKGHGEELCMLAVLRRARLLEDIKRANVGEY